MPRNNYDEIKQKFEAFIQCWNTQEYSNLDLYILPEASCYLSIEGAYPEGGRHGLIGIRNFFENLIHVHISHIRSYNFVCHVNGNVARQSASIVGVVASEDMRVCELNCIFSNVWEYNEEWKLKSIRMDVCECIGDFKEYYEKWYFEDEKTKWYAGIHLPVISGEMDSPWNLEQKEELSEEEKIQEVFYRYAFGIDTLSFPISSMALSDDCIINMAPFGAMDKREFLQSLKLHRKGSLHWIHPGKVKSIQINENNAIVEMYRMAGHRQRYENGFEWNEETIHHEYACARYTFKMTKEDTEWKIIRFDYYLGLIDLGNR